jgi:hypothetical protein
VRQLTLTPEIWGRDVIVDRDLANQKYRSTAVAYASASERDYAMRLQETILERLGKTLHVRMDEITHEPLPRRWVDLIHHLNEEERKRSDRQPGSEPQQR